MRKINVANIRRAVSSLCLKANFELRKDIMDALKSALKKERHSRARGLLKAIIDNANLAKAHKLAICQDTGMVVVHLEIGQKVTFTGGDLRNAVNKGVEDAYRKGYLRKSVVNDPHERKNTGTNAPAVIHADIVSGSRVKISVSPKGFGSENKSMTKMFRPTARVDDIISFVKDVVREAGPDACPPLVLGIGIGGTFETAALLAKKALLRPVHSRNPKKHISALEDRLLKSINAMGIGPMGLGGRATALSVNIMEYPTHIAGLPVAVNVSCHATRSAETVI